jgi:hypothetical protein
MAVSTGSYLVPPEEVVHVGLRLDQVDGEVPHQVHHAAADVVGQHLGEAVDGRRVGMICCGARCPASTRGCS